MKLTDFLRNLFTRNLGMKIAALCLSFAFWIAFINLADPVSTDSYALKLGVENFEEYLNNGHFVELADGSPLSEVVLNVTVRGRISVLKALSDNKNIDSVVRAYVDVYETENSILKIHYAIDPSYADSLELSSLSNTAYQEVSAEVISFYTLPIRAELKGAPAAGMRILENDPNFTISQETVTVYGPASRLQDYSAAYAEVVVSRAETSIRDTRPLHFTDARGNELTPDGRVVFAGISEVEVYVPVYQIKNLKITVLVSGQAPDRYLYLDDLAFSRDSVEVFGLEEDLVGIEELRLPAINLGSIFGEYSRQYKLSDLLKSMYGDRIRLNDEDASVTVRLHTAELITRTVRLDLSGLSIKNVPEGWSCELLTEDAQLVLNGLASALDKAEADMKLSVTLPDAPLEGLITLMIEAEGLPDSVTVVEGAEINLLLSAH